MQVFETLVGDLNYKRKIINIQNLLQRVIPPCLHLSISSLSSLNSLLEFRGKFAENMLHTLRKVWKKFVCIKFLFLLRNVFPNSPADLEHNDLRWKVFNGLLCVFVSWLVERAGLRILY